MEANDILMAAKRIERLRVNRQAFRYARDRALVEVLSALQAAGVDRDMARIVLDAGKTAYLAELDRRCAEDMLELTGLGVDVSDV